MKGGELRIPGLDFRLTRTRRGLWRPYVAPKAKKRTEVLSKLRQVFRSQVSHPVDNVIVRINPILRGRVNYFRIGDSHRSFKCVRAWTERRVRRHLMRQQNRSGFGWKTWSTAWLHQELALFNEYRLTLYLPRVNALPDR